MVEWDADEVGAASLLLSSGDVAALDGVAHVLRPVEVGDEVFNLVWSIAQGI